MKTHIRWKLMLAAMVVALIPTWFVSDSAVKAFNVFNSRALEADMLAQAYMIREVFRGGSTNTLLSVLRQCESKTGSRIRLFTTEGAILADSSADAPNDLPTLTQGKEFTEARNGRKGSRWNLVPDKSKVIYYVALPAKDSTGHVTAIIHVTHDTADITRAILDVVYDHRTKIAIAVASALLLAMLISYSITRRLSRLTQAAVLAAAGRPDVIVPIEGRDEVGELGRAVRHMKDEIERRNQYNRDFITTTMHELKMPLTAIKGAAELLEQGAADRKDVRDKFIGNIRYEADRLIRMVWELGELTRLDTEALHAQKVEVDYGTFVKEVVERMEVSLDTDHPTIRVTVPDGKLPIRIIPGRIEQVIGNLIDNAIRYTPAIGRIDIIVKSMPNGTIMTTVRDTGCGIAPGNLPHVFERFFTTEPKDKPKDYGSGLGLAVAKSIVESHRGTIRVESEPGKGAAFVFTLPI